MKLNIPKIRRKMKAQNMREIDLAKATGFSKQYINYVLKNPENTKRVERIAEVLGVNPKSIIE